MNLSPSDAAENNKFGPSDPGDGRPHDADTAIKNALDALEMDLISAFEFADAMQAWNEGAWDEFKDIIDGKE